MLKVKRIYEARQNDDGIRILVDRLWPRGLSSAKAGIDEWMKELSPSDKLRQWFAHKTENWLEFRQRYMEELANPQKVEALERIARLSLNSNVTLVYAARDSEHNNAIVLAEYVTSLTKGLAQAPETEG